MTPFKMRVGLRCLASRILSSVSRFRTPHVPLQHSGSKIYRNPSFAGDRNLILLQYDCSQCTASNSEILLSEMYQNNLVMVECTECATRYALAEQLQWFRDICSKNPQLLQGMVNTLADCRQKQKSKKSANFEACQSGVFLKGSYFNH